MKYFIREDGQPSQVNELETPTYARECLSKCQDKLDENGNVIEKATWQEITEQQYKDLTKEPPYEQPKPTYDELVQEKLIAKGYTHDKQIAILCNGTDTAEHKAEFDEMQAVRQQCKAEARKEV